MQRAVLIAVGAVFTALVVFVVTIVAIDAASEDRVADGVKVGNLDAGGMTRDQLTALVRSRLAPVVDQPVAATYHGHRFVLRPVGVQARLDVKATVDAALREGRANNPFSRVLGGSDGGGTVAPKLVFSHAELAAFTQRVARRVNRPARDAG